MLPTFNNSLVQQKQPQRFHTEQFKKKIPRRLQRHLLNTNNTCYTIESEDYNVLKKLFSGHVNPSQ